MRRRNFQIEQPSAPVVLERPRSYEDDEKPFSYNVGLVVQTPKKRGGRRQPNRRNKAKEVERFEAEQDNSYDALKEEN